MKHTFLLAGSFFVLLSIISCRQEVEYTQPEDAGISFFNASVAFREVMTSGNKYIFLDNNTDTLNTVPPRFGEYSYQLQFPDPTASQGVVAPGAEIPVSYMRLAAGAHAIRVNDPDKNEVAKLDVQLTKGSRHVVYVTDSLGADKSIHFTGLAVPEGEPVAAGIRIRVVHLSPDVKDLNVYQLGPEDVRLFPDNRPVNMGYRQVSNYFLPDVTKKVRDKLLLRFYEGTDTANVVLTTIIPTDHIPAAYEIIINGYKTGPAYRYPVTGGKLYRLSPNLRASVRVVR